MGIGSVTVRNHMLTYPVVDPVAYSSRGGDCRHWSATPCPVAGPPIFASRSGSDAVTCGPSVGFLAKVCLSPKREPRRGLPRVGGCPGRGSGTLMAVPPSVVG